VKASPEPEIADASLADRLARRIAADGPLTVEAFMAAANSHYYATRDPLGRGGDFITAPEVSQMFGELVGVWIADIWARSGRPPNCRYVELGPGRGTLAADALRAMRGAGLNPDVQFVETSPVLRKAQRERVPDARWHEHIAGLPRDGPLIIVANEFFDALPIRQLIAVPHGWRERMVDYRGGGFVPVPGAPADDAPGRNGTAGSIQETSPQSLLAIREIADRIGKQGGAGLIVDYGHVRSAAGETLQAVRAHQFTDPWTAPGESDLTAHVDFEALAGAARPAGTPIYGPIEQGTWLRAIGIDIRAAALAEHAPARAGEIGLAHARLTAADQMGSLFKVMALTASNWAEPAGF
jgi:SAM-dependent MidA family methyltransferase